MLAETTPNIEENLTEVRLSFDTAQQLQAILANDEKNLRDLEKIIPIKTMTRDSWVNLSGKPTDVDQAQRGFQDLEDALKSGMTLFARDFRLAFQLAAQSKETNGLTLAQMSKLKLQGMRGRKPIVPRTPQQLHYLQQMLAHDIVFGLGPAGTGKTYLAMAMGLSMLKQKEVKRIILARPAVEAGEALGFLPGDLKEKVAPYLRPMYDALNDMLPYDEAERLLEEGIIEIAPLAYMRGRTLSHAFIILDEAQNTTEEQMFMLLTRIGENSRCVITGDASQIDLKPNIQSGLLEATTALRNTKGVGQVTFEKEDVIRHPVVARVINDYEKHRNLP